MGPAVVKRSPVALAAMLAVVVAAAGACAPRQKPRARRAAQPRPAPVSVSPAPPSHLAWGDHTIATRLAEIGPRARRRWQGWFREAGVAYPPASAKLVVFKRERELQVFAGPSAYALRLVRTIPVTAASGGPGPKLREGDRQVPEGIYDIDKLNPNSLFHVSMRLAYPNAFDARMARRDGRRNLGGAIMIHGSDRSIGCVAVGDEAAEDLFVLTADSGLWHVGVVIVPRDFRRTGERQPAPGQPPWVGDLYAMLDLELRSLPTTRAGHRVAPAPRSAAIRPEEGPIDPAALAQNRARITSR